MKEKIVVNYPSVSAMGKSGYGGPAGTSPPDPTSSVLIYA